MSAPNKRARMAESLPAEQLVGGDHGSLPVFREGEASEELTDISYFMALLNHANNGVARAGMLACLPALPLAG